MKHFWPPCEKNQQGCQNFIVNVQRNLMGNNWFSITFLFFPIYFGVWAKVFWLSCNFFQQICQKYYLRVPSIFLKLIIWSEKVTISISYWCWAKNSHSSCKVFLLGWQNCSLCVNWNFLRIHIPFQKKKYVSLVFEQPANLSAFLKQNSCGVVEKAFNVYLGTFWENTSSKKLLVFYYIQTMSENISVFVGIFPAGISIMLSKRSLERV